MTGIEPVTTCLGNKHSVHLSYILIGSIDGGCTRFSMLERHGDFSTPFGKQATSTMLQGGGDGI